MNALPFVDLLRTRASGDLNPENKSHLGQFFTSAPISEFMSSLFIDLSGDVRLLDPGCGIGSLFAAFIDETIRRGKTQSLHLEIFEIDTLLEPYLSESLRVCSSILGNEKVDFSVSQKSEDFILAMSAAIRNQVCTGKIQRFSHIIMNPPYKKIRSSSEYREALRKVGIETVNLYAGFVALSIILLQEGGELVAIIPRSFTNGPYFKAFRDILFSETCIKQIHIFDSRNTAFSDDDVLQENIIFHCVKGASQKNVVISSSPTADFHRAEGLEGFVATDMTLRDISFENIVYPDDPQNFLHIPTTHFIQDFIDHLSIFTSTLDDIDIQVSTGPVVDFRLKSDLRQELGSDCAPLIYPTHLNGGVVWPLHSKKPNAIKISDQSRKWLWDNRGSFVITRRFSSKEEKRRIVASVYDGSLPGKYIGFDNKLNVFHSGKKGIDKQLAKGLYVFLNSTLVDRYYRQFGGHTQVNATDLRSMNYPTTVTLERLGNQINNLDLTQHQIDELLETEIARLAGNVDKSTTK